MSRIATILAVVVLAGLTGAAVWAPLVATDRPLWVHGVPRAAFARDVELLRDVFPADLAAADPSIDENVRRTLLAMHDTLAPSALPTWHEIEASWRGAENRDEREAALARAARTAAEAGPREIAGSPAFAAVDGADVFAMSLWIAVLGGLVTFRWTPRRRLGAAIVGFFAVATALFATRAAMAGDAVETDSTTLRALASDGGRVIDAPIPFAPDQAVRGAGALRPGEVDVEDRVHWLGTDPDGRDIASRLVWGARTSLTVGVATVAMLLVIGLLIGVLAGSSRTLEPFASRVIELFDAFPPLLLVMIAVAVFDRGLWVIIVVLGATAWTKPALLTRAEVAHRMQEPFVEAARTLGLERWRVLLLHVLPNAAGPALVHATFALAGAILAEAGLSFLGLGSPRDASWGQVIQSGVGSLSAWWISVFPGALLFLTVLSVRTIGARYQDRSAVA